jgi:hypothetical protein
MPGQSNCSLEGSREQFVVLGNIEHHIGWTVFCHAVHLTILERTAGVVPESKQIGAIPGMPRFPPANLRLWFCKAQPAPRRYDASPDG